MTNQYIFIFSIGPVQSFIAQARKTQDLYGGSRLLSELCQIAMTYASSSQGIDILFPVQSPTAKSIPNRFIGLKTLHEGENTNLQEIGEELERHIQKEFMTLAKSIFIDFDISMPIGFEEQIKNHLDLNWLFYPIETNYETDYEKAEQWLGSIKNTRIFKQNPEKGRKCNLDGERNVKFYRPSEDEKDINRILEYKLFQKRNEVCIVKDSSRVPLSMLQHGEGLSAVSFIKRAFEKNLERKVADFPSTARIAMMSDLSNIKNQDAYECFKAMFGKDFDAQLCYEENLTENYLKKNGYKAVLEKIKLKDLEDLRKKAFEKQKLQKYYALIVFDGDHMGKIMSGTFLKTESKGQLKLFQKRTSELLLNFAGIAESCLKDKGATVYAGGDDFLGFINLTHLYTVMAELRSEFDKEVNQKLNNEFAIHLDDFNFTFSAGVAIAHYKTPLSIVLKKAREMEHLAKEKGDRNAFALSVIKHSGESHETVFKWDYLQKLETIHLQLLEENYSNTFIKSIHRELSDFQSNFKNPKSDFVKSGVGRKLALKEIERLVKRSKMSDKAAITMPEIVQDVFKESKTFQNFTEALNITQFTKRQIKLE